MEVIIRDRSRERPWGHGPNQPVIRKVEISDNCPRCGEKRGKPQNHPTYDDGEWYHVHTWKNPCGHVDFYEDVAKEAELLRTKETLPLEFKSKKGTQ